mmetsp:Transcript_15514/g.42088  ORF Transcript_15514/g.42088 Transcript_15514/m.42088 type:complete len:97 (-) Transcript_15514:2738-3028(-)
MRSVAIVPSQNDRLHEECHKEDAFVESEVLQTQRSSKDTFRMAKPAVMCDYCRNIAGTPDSAPMPQVCLGQGKNNKQPEIDKSEDASDDYEVKVPV